MRRIANADTNTYLNIVKVDQRHCWKGESTPFITLDTRIIAYMYKNIEINTQNRKSHGFV